MSQEESKAYFEAPSSSFDVAEQGHLHIEVERSRQGTFDPQLVKKGQTRLAGFDDKILSLYARGMTTRIQAQLQERDARGGLADAHART